MDMRRILGVVACLVLLTVGGCMQSVDQRSAFAQYAEQFGAPAGVTETDDNHGSGTSASSNERQFRRSMTVTIANNDPDVELNIGMAAWVNTGSIRSANQQDALIDAGFVQLTREARIGDVFTLPPGTFVFNGAGNAG